MWPTKKHIESSFTVDSCRGKKFMSEKFNDGRGDGLLSGRLTSFRKFAQSFVAVLQVIGPFSDQRFQD